MVAKSCLLAFAAVALLAADDPSWKNKLVSEWDQEDARQVLANSPWVKSVTLNKVRDLSKFERRDGGDWEAGIGPTVGFAAIGLFGPTLEEIALERAHVRPYLGTVSVRWESALPVRAAEQKTGEVGVPASAGDYYTIAVYDVLRPSIRWNVPNQLKEVAFLKRNHKKDIKPSRVVVLPRGNGLVTVFYLFPRSAEINKQDGSVQFAAQIGRLFVSQLFVLGDMVFQGKPEY